MTDQHSTPDTPRESRFRKALRLWIDSGATERAADDRGGREIAGARIEWLRCIPFLLIHVAVLAVFLVGWSPVAVWTALALYWIRMFAITGFYHRYFSHRSFRTSRPVQFLMAVLGCTAIQRGPLWWAAHHRFHHVHSDTEHDPHSPRELGFWMSHMGWFMTEPAFPVRERYVRDWKRFPELVLLDRFDWLVPILFGAALWGFGVGLEAWFPTLGTSGAQMLVWGFAISTVACYHATYTINSLSHMYGSRRFATPDDSRNNWMLALLTLGEGWHNNHHHYPAAARQGFYWWEVDITYYGLKVMSWFRLVWGLKPVPDRALATGRESG